VGLSPLLAALLVHFGLFHVGALVLDDLALLLELLRARVGLGPERFFHVVELGLVHVHNTGARRCVPHVAQEVWAARFPRRIASSWRFDRNRHVLPSRIRAEFRAAFYKQNERAECVLESW
jgi:hypothetical protein